MSPDDPTTYLPLRPAHYLILLSLAEGDLHGYAIKKDVARRTEGRVRLGAGSLYRSLAQLEDDGLVAESEWRPREALDDDRRRYLRLTSRGRAVAAAETERLARLVEGARAVGIAP